MDTNAVLRQVKDEMETYNVRELWGPRCERCRIYCDIFDFDEIVTKIRAGVFMTRAPTLRCDLIEVEPSATDCPDHDHPVRCAMKKFTLADWTFSYTVCSEEYLAEMLQCVPQTVRNEKRAKPAYMKWIYIQEH